MNEPQEAQPIPRFTSQKSWDGLSHRMVEFESGEYVRYADFHKAEAALAEAQEKLRNATGTIQRLEQEQVHMAAPALAEAALAEAQQEIATLRAGLEQRWKDYKDQADLAADLQRKHSLAQQRIRELEAALAEAQDEVELKTIAANSMRVSMEQAQQRIRELEQALAKLQL